jgi:hypothetical protein
MVPPGRSYRGIGADLGSLIDALKARVDGLNTRLDEHIGGHRHTG